MSHVLREPEMKNSEGPFLYSHLVGDFSCIRILMLEGGARKVGTIERSEC